MNDNPVIFEARFTTLDLKTTGAAALIAVDMVLNAREQQALTCYNVWLRKERDRQKRGLEAVKHLFEENDNLEGYESFKRYYFAALDAATTQQELLQLYMEKLKISWEQIQI